MNHPIVDVKELAVRFSAENGTLTVLDIAGLQVYAGEQVSIAGPSGSGKSTLLHVLAGILVPSSGSVSVCSTEITRLNEAMRDRFRAKHIGYIFQNFNLLQGYSVLENVLLGMTLGGVPADKRAAKALLDELGLGHRLDSYPSTLSMGEQQRVAIARALAKRPALVLADEPTGSLDPLRTRSAIDQLTRMCQERQATLLVVSHEQEVIQRFPRVIPFLDLNRAFTGKDPIS